MTDNNRRYFPIGPLPQGMGKTDQLPQRLAETLTFLEGGRISYPHFERPISELGNAIHKALSEDSTFHFTIQGLDFTVVEQHVLQGILAGGGKLLLDFESSGGDIPGPLDLIQRMQDNMAEFRKVYRVSDVPKKPTKQNGRSAEYLKHDPSKRNRRRGR